MYILYLKEYTINSLFKVLYNLQAFLKENKKNNIITSIIFLVEHLALVEVQKV